MAEMRKFETGATRNIDVDKLDFEGFLCPLVLEEFAKFMHTHRIQADGQLRDSDNWQKGMPRKEYMKSGWRHFRNWWRLHRGYQAFDEHGKPVTLMEECSALMFNVMGYMHETLKAAK